MSDWTTRRVAPLPSRRRDPLLRSLTHERESPLRNLDFVLLAAVLSLCAAGAVLVWSATQDSGYLKKDVLNIVIGLSLGSATALVDYRAMRAYAPIVYGLCIVGLLAVLTPLGSTVNGSHSWIKLGGGFEVQPSEFGKLALVIGLALLLGEVRDGEDAPRDSDVLGALLLAAVPMGLVLAQPDLGTVMVLVFVVLGVLAVSGAPARWVLGLIVLGALGGFMVAHLHLLKDYQLARFKAVTDPNAASNSFGYQTQQARIAIGSGGMFGRGLFHGSQTNGHFVPEQQTDFIFSVAGEELGFVGAGTIVLLTGIVLWRGLRIAADAEDLYGRLLATGIVCWFAFQSFENVGMSVGIMPMTGLPLPFVSYGGSSMFASLIGVGLLQSVHMRSRE